MKYVSFFAGHDANLTFHDTETGKYHIIELERLQKKRYFRLHVDNSPKEIREILQRCAVIAQKYWGFPIGDYEAVIAMQTGWYGMNPQEMQSIFGARRLISHGLHHDCHAASTFFQSPYNEAIIISYDGGGDEEFFDIYHGKGKTITKVQNIRSDFGGGYLLCGSLIKEVAGASKHHLSLAGKLMGLCAYGCPIPEMVDAFADFFVDRDYRKLAERTKLPLPNVDHPWQDALNNIAFEGVEGYNVAATAQAGFEKAFFRLFDKVRKLYPTLPVCMTGGASLNVLVNEKIKTNYGVDVFVPPNPNDCGLSLGAMFMVVPPETININVAYNGIPLLDSDELDSYVAKRNAVKTNKVELANLLKQGKIIGFVYGDSEVGPRALGNRSIVCDPSYPNMKNILNAKVKFREWYRPFAPFCKKDDASTFFDSRNFENYEFMSYAPVVKNEWKDALPSITHADGSARLQTVTANTHAHFYELLTEFNKISKTKVLLNTSFNIRGNPILTTIEDALYVLDTTELDYVVVEDWLFAKKV